MATLILRSAAGTPRSGAVAAETSLEKRGARVDQRSAIVVLFTRNPRPGRAKTRLIGELSAQQAAQIHGAFVGDMVEELAEGGFRLEVAWALDSGEQPALDLLPVEVPYSSQSGDDLGERLYRALSAASRKALFVAAVGSDHPDLRRERVEDAFQRLAAGCDIAVGPAVDGGYYLIAMRSAVLDRRLFQDIEWSTPIVLDQTLDRCAELGLSVERLPAAADVDTPADLERLVLELRADPSRCPRTRALLEQWGRL